MKLTGQRIARSTRDRRDSAPRRTETEPNRHTGARSPATHEAETRVLIGG